MLKEFLFDDRDTLFHTLSQHCQQHLQSALEQKGRASFMASGGSTPAPLYEALSLSNLDWAKIHIALVDERWLDKQHPASNEALLYRSLLIHHAQQAPFTGMKTPASQASTGQPETETLYRNIPQPFTITLLGMGSDGHTASLFPHAQGLSEALDKNNSHLTAAIVAKQSEVTGVNTKRLTLTLNGLLKSERLIILLTGDEKLAVLRKAMTEGAVEDMPIRAILYQDQVPVELYWAP